MKYQNIAFIIMKKYCIYQIFDIDIGIDMYFKKIRYFGIYRNTEKINLYIYNFGILVFLVYRQFCTVTMLLFFFYTEFLAQYRIVGMQKIYQKFDIG